MKTSIRAKEFEKWVKNKFDVYNSLFLNLPYHGVSNVGILLPLMSRVCQQGLESGQDPLEILDAFFRTHTNATMEQEKIDFMFKVIQYIERQVVLFDSVEDAAFTHLNALADDLSIRDYINLSNNQNLGSILEKLSTFSARIVFTAHPTQFYTHSVLDIIGKLRTYIESNDINQIDLTLQQLGLTSLINTRKPTPFDEAKNIIYFLQHVYYDAVGDLYAHIKHNVPNADFDNPHLIQLGFWPGGDRDGNPFVTADITMKVADELRMTLMKCYYQDVRNLSRKLTFKDVHDVIVTLANRIYETMIDPANVISSADILDALSKIRAALIEDYNSLYLDDLDRFIDKVHIFQTHFAILDIRQNHSVHRRLVEEILKKKGRIDHTLDELAKDDLIALLLEEHFQVEADQFDDALLRDTIETMAHIKTIQHKNGEAGCHRYIISNSEDMFAVLFVYGLLRWCSWQDEAMPIDIVPLIESMNAMQNAEAIMDALFAIPAYRAHLSQRGDKQTIMLGFSDGTKDGGYLQANWSIFKTKETLSALCEKHGIQVIFFDGRGGPPARGGGKTHRFYASQSQRIANHAIQLTIQGQTITSKYGTKAHFIHHFEQLLTAGLSQSMFGQENTISETARNTIERLAQIGYNKYDALKKNAMFVPYLENKSTLKYYGQTKIGSRPDKRGNKKTLDLSDLRAIPFVGSWSQLKQNVPGYYGVGTALHTLVEEGTLDELKALFNDVPFFKALILNSMMSLSKCNFALTRYIARDEKYREFWHLLYEEYKLSKEMTLLISGYGALMEEEEVARRSIEIREHIVLPLLTIQQYALQKIEADAENRAIYEKIVRRSLYGNINASRNAA